MLDSADVAGAAGVDIGPQVLGVAVGEQGPDDRVRGGRSPVRQAAKLIPRDQVLREEPAEAGGRTPRISTPPGLRREDPGAYVPTPEGRAAHLFEGAVAGRLPLLLGPS